MGSCISKCKRKRKHQEKCNHVQDKLVISQAPNSSVSLSSTSEHPLSPHSPTSVSSASSLSCTTSNSCSLTSSLSSSSSISSSIIGSKERSFSNEFLYSCAKENPQIIRVDPIKGSLKKPVLVKQNSPDAIQCRKLGSNPQKRARGNSPVLSRQKSFRRENEIPNSTNYFPSRNLRSPSPSRRWENEIPNSPNYFPSRNLRSPSPSRRFSGENNYRGDLTNRHKEICCKNSGFSKENAMKRENIRPLSPSRNLGRNRACLLKRENSIHRICPTIDEIGIGEDVLSKQDVDVIAMEDIDNPLIALDCFIFL